MPAPFRARPTLFAVIIGVVLARAAFAWPAGGAVVCSAPCDQTATSVLADGAGGVYLAWEDNRSCGNKHAYIQHLDGQGAVVAGWPVNGRPVCTSVVGQVLPELVADGSGGAIAVWQDYRSGATVFAQRFQSDGTALWNLAGVAVSDSAGQWATSSLADSAGGVFVAWDDTRRGLHAGPAHDALYDFFAQHIDGNGVRLWGPYAAPITRQLHSFGGAIVIGNSAAGTLVAMVQQGMQRLDANGQDLLGASGTSPAGMTLYELCTDGAGGLISLYTRGIAAGVVGLYAARADGAGNVLWGADDSKLVATMPVDAFFVRVVPDGEGGAYVAWYDETHSSGDADIYVQRVNASGEVASGWPANGIDLTSTAGLRIPPSLTPDGAHGVLVTWQDGRDAASGFDVYAQRMTGNGAIAPGWPSAGLRLEHAAGDQVRPVCAADGTGGVLVAWTDMSGDGDVYATRVSAAGTLDVTVIVPSFAFAIAGVYPNPSPDGAVRVSLSLPSTEPAHVSLIDVQGRLVARQEVRVASGGSTTVSLAARSHLPPGVYRVRLDQLGRTASRVVAVVR